MTSMSVYSLMIVVIIISLISVMPISVQAFDIDVNGIEMKFTPTATAFTSTLWSSACEVSGLVPTDEFVDTNAVVGLLTAMRTFGDNSISVWRRRIQDDVTGDYTCSAIKYMGSSYAGSDVDCSENHFFTCQVQTPVIKNLAPSEAISGLKSLQCTIDVFSGIIYTYRWFFKSTSSASYIALSTSDSELSYDTIDSSEVGNYACIAATGGTKSLQSSAYFLIDNVPAPQLKTDASQKEPGGVSWLSCHAPSHVVKYVWKKDGKEVDSLGHGNFVFILNFTHVDAGNYTCSVFINGRQSPESNVQTLEMIVPQPTLSIITFFLGENADLECESAYAAHVDRTYSWFKVIGSGLTLLTGHPVTGNTLTIQSLATTDVGDYRCLETIGSVSSSTSSLQSLNFQIQQPTLVTKENNTAIAIGDQVTMTCLTGYVNNSVSRLYYFYRRSAALTTSLKYNGGSFSILSGRTSSAGIDWLSALTLSHVTISSFSSSDETRYMCAEKIGTRISGLSEQLILTSVTVTTPTFASSESVVTLGSSVTFTCDDGMSTPNSNRYKWFYSNDPVGNSVTMDVETDNKDLTITSFQPNHIGQYACSVILPSSTISDKSTWYTVNFDVPKPIAIMKPNPIRLGDTLTFKCQEQYTQTLDATDEFSNSPGMGYTLQYRWFGTDLGPDSTSRAYGYMPDFFDIYDYKCKNVGKFECLQEIDTVISDKSDMVSLSFTVPAPEVEMVDPDQEVNPSTYLYLTCVSQYDSEEIPRKYQFYYKFEDSQTYNPAYTNIRDSENSTILLTFPFWSCTEIIETVESPLSDWIQINHTLETPTLEEFWDEVNDKMILTCNHVYFTNFGNTAHSAINWFQNDVALSTTGLTKPAPNKLRLDGRDMASEEGTFRCSLTVYFFTSNRSGEANIDANLARPKLKSTSRRTVPSGSEVTLTCEWLAKSKDGYKFKRGSKLLAWKKQNTYRIKKFSESDNGDYSCSVNIVTDTRRSPVVPLETVDAFAVCYCPCDNTTTKEANVTKEVVDQIVAEIKGNLTVEKSTLSAAIREKTSAPDERTSSVSAGAAAIAIIAFCFLLIVVPDTIRLGIWLGTMIRNCTMRSASVDFVSNR